MQQLSSIGWAIRPLKNYAKFSGRASRAEFWWFFLFVMIIYVVIAFGFGFSAAALTNMKPAAGGSFGAFGLLGIFIMIFWLALIIPVIAVQVRRLHDTNRSGWWLGAFYLGYFLYLLIAIRSLSGLSSIGGSVSVGIFSLLFLAYAVALVVFYCLAGTSGPNRFGDDPYGPDVEQVFA